MEHKVFEDTTGNRNGRILNIQMDEKLIGMPDQHFGPHVPFSEGETMRNSVAGGKLFPDGSNKAEGAGVINKNGEYGPVTYGF